MRKLAPGALKSAGAAAGGAHADGTMGQSDDGRASATPAPTSTDEEVFEVCPLFVPSRHQSVARVYHATGPICAENVLARRLGLGVGDELASAYSLHPPRAPDRHGVHVVAQLKRLGSNERIGGDARAKLEPPSFADESPPRPATAIGDHDGGVGLVSAVGALTDEERLAELLDGLSETSSSGGDDDNSDDELDPQLKQRLQLNGRRQPHSHPHPQQDPWARRVPPWRQQQHTQRAGAVRRSTEACPSLPELAGAGGGWGGDRPATAPPVATDTSLDVLRSSQSTVLVTPSASQQLMPSGFGVTPPSSSSSFASTSTGHLAGARGASGNHHHRHLPASAAISSPLLERLRQISVLSESVDEEEDKRQFFAQLDAVRRSAQPTDEGAVAATADHLRDDALDAYLPQAAHPSSSISGHDRDEGRHHPPPSPHGPSARDDGGHNDDVPPRSTATETTATRHGGDDTTGAAAVGRDGMTPTCRAFSTEVGAGASASSWSPGVGSADGDTASTTTTTDGDGNDSPVVRRSNARNSLELPRRSAAPPSHQEGALPSRWSAEELQQQQQQQQHEDAAEYAYAEALHGANDDGTADRRRTDSAATAAAGAEEPAQTRADNGSDALATAVWAKDAGQDWRQLPVAADHPPSPASRPASLDSRQWSAEDRDRGTAAAAEADRPRLSATAAEGRPAENGSWSPAAAEQLTAAAVEAQSVADDGEEEEERGDGGSGTHRTVASTLPTPTPSPQRSRLPVRQSPSRRTPSRGTHHGEREQQRTPPAAAAQKTRTPPASATRAPRAAARLQEEMLGGASLVELGVSKAELRGLERLVHEQEQLLGAYQLESERAAQELRQAKQHRAELERQLRAAAQGVPYEASSTSSAAAAGFGGAAPGTPSRPGGSGTAPNSSGTPLRHSGSGGFGGAAAAAAESRREAEELKHALDRARSLQQAAEQGRAEAEAKLRAHGGVQELEARLRAQQDDARRLQGSLRAAQEEAQQAREQLRWYQENQALIDASDATIARQKEQLTRLEAQVEELRRAEAAREPSEGGGGGRRGGGGGSARRGGSAAAARRREDELRREVGKLKAELEDVVRKKWAPDSLPSLIRAARPSAEETEAQAFLTEKAKRLELALAQKEEEHEKRLRVLRQGFEKTKAAHERRLAELEVELSAKTRALEHEQRPHLRVKELERQLDDTRTFYTKKLRELASKQQQQQPARSRQSGRGTQHSKSGGGGGASEAARLKREVRRLESQVQELQTCLKQQPAAADPTPSSPTVDTARHGAHPSGGARTPRKPPGGGQAAATGASPLFGAPGSPDADVPPAKGPGPAAAAAAAADATSTVPPSSATDGACSQLHRMTLTLWS
jgi:hypothetical protein